MNDGVGFLMKKNKVDDHLGRGHDRRARQDHGEGQSRPQAPKGALGPGTYKAKHIIVATGARPRVLPGSSPTRS